MFKKKGEEFLSWENLIYIADFLQAGVEKHISLLGGEPTLHPAFNDFVLYLLERNFQITVFTSGIMEQGMLEEATSLYRDLPTETLSFVCNVNDPEKTNASVAEKESIARFFLAFGPRVCPGFNIYRKDFELDFLFKYINEFGLKRTLRIGLAHPIPQFSTDYVSLGDLESVIQRLFSYIPMFGAFRVKPGLDCGFPLCRFSDAHLSWLYRYTGGKSQFGCGAVIDIGPDMSVWPCFPLYESNRKSLFEFDSFLQVHDYYTRLHQVVRTEVGGIFEECDDCQLREDGVCNGGCIAHSMARFHQEAPLRVKAVYL